MMDSSMKISTKCMAAVKKVNSILRVVRKEIENKTADIVMLLYKSMVQSYLEYHALFKSTHLKNNIIDLENVQRKANKILSKNGSTFLTKTGYNSTSQMVL